ncbi:hypothetical protein GCM10023195_41790 [Actinoallomurus liliacearum]|uniref:GerMN domain-containing protein n=1 Tax=Actinoallomurus liliacearum TaxID=1080073 RepID=A0ABP8TK66_9ACTN
MTRVVRAVSAAAAICVLAGCGVRPTGVVGAGEAPTATATSLPKAQVFFLHDGTPEPVERAVPPWDTQAVFDALLAGPTAQERERGLRTELRSDVTIHAIGTRTVFVESRRQQVSQQVSQQEVAGYLQISCTARLLPGAPLVKAPGLLDPALVAKVYQANVCLRGGDPAGNGPIGPRGARSDGPPEVPSPTPSGSSYTGGIGPSPTDDPAYPVGKKGPSSPRNGAPSVVKPTG